MSSRKKIRPHQRQRTRSALVQSALQAIQRGETPTLESAAESAGVSRATAYRYFASQQALLLETSLEAFNATNAECSINEGPVEFRVDAAVRTLLSMADQHEVSLRIFLVSSIELWLRSRKDGTFPVRKGRRLEWLNRALAPVTGLTSRQQRRLNTALSMLCGIESLIVAKDVCHCSAREAEETCAWAAQAILRAALDPSPSPRPAQAAKQASTGNKKPSRSLKS